MMEKYWHIIFIFKILLSKPRRNFCRSVLWNMCRSSLQLTKVPEPRGFSISPVTPGIFKGTYGSHGLEFVHITLSEDGYTLLGNKLTVRKNPVEISGKRYICGQEKIKFYVKILEFAGKSILDRKLVSLLVCMCIVLWARHIQFMSVFFIWLCNIFLL